MRALILSACFALSAAAQADVIYNWQTIDSAGSNMELSGQLIVTDEAWRSGSVTYRHDAGCYPAPACFIDPDSPVLLLEFAAEFDGTGIRVWNEYREGNGAFGDGQRSGVSVAFVGDGLVGGDVFFGRASIFNGGSVQYMELKYNGATTWELLAIMNFDNVIGCRYTEPPDELQCPRVIGRWVLDASTVPVSAPGTLGLAGASLFLLAVRRRLGYKATVAGMRL
jgi:hypothetical protein